MKCEHCKKTKAILMKCTCCKSLCLKCFAPMKHNCERIKVCKNTLITEATGVFKKIEKI